MPEGISAILPILQLGTAGSGLVGNILNSIQQGNVASAAEKNAKLTPEQLGTMVSKATAPLDRNLINAVTNQVQGDVASRGLAESPGIFAATEGQALAPFEQANQDRALQLILSKLGLPASTLLALRSGGGGMANLSPLLQMIMKMFPGSQPNNFNYWAANNANPTVPFQNQGPVDLTPPDIFPSAFTTPPDTGGA